jgi:hypothetical protein
MDLFLSYLGEKLGLATDAYTSHSISEISFHYIIRHGQPKDNYKKLLQDLSNKSITTHRFNNMQ